MKFWAASAAIACAMFYPARGARAADDEARRALEDAISAYERGDYPEGIPIAIRAEQLAASSVHELLAPAHFIRGVLESILVEETTRGESVLSFLRALKVDEHIAEKQPAKRIRFLQQSAKHAMRINFACAETFYRAKLSSDEARTHLERLARPLTLDACRAAVGEPVAIATPPPEFDPGPGGPRLGTMVITETTTPSADNLPLWPAYVGTALAVGGAATSLVFYSKTNQALDRAGATLDPSVYLAEKEDASSALKNSNIAGAAAGVAATLTVAYLIWYLADSD